MRHNWAATRLHSSVFTTRSAMSHMSSVIVASVIIMMCWTVTGQDTPHGCSSRNVLNFITSLNGNYDNSAQIAAGATDHDYIQARVIPVKVPGLNKGPVLYIGWAFNGVLLNMLLCEVTEQEDGDIYITLHNFTHNNQYKFDEFSIEDLSKVTVEASQDGIPCEAAFEPMGYGIFVGTWPECRYSSKGQHPPFADTIDCDEIRIVIPLASKEKTTPVPYNLMRNGNRYPLNCEILDSFVSLCDKS